MENEVEIIEIWEPCEGKDSEAILFKDNTPLKRVAIVANGVPIYLEEGVVLEKHYITKDEYNKIAPNGGKCN